MSVGAIILIILLIGMLIIGVPVAFTLLVSASIAIYVNDGNLIGIVQKLYSTNDSFPLLAIPFFVIAGDVMLEGGISKRIVNFAKTIFGQAKGSLAIISIVACAFFGAISGSAYATTASIGSIMYPEMTKDGYERGLAAVIQAAGGTLGILIPPSIPFVVYGVLTQNSIGELFMATVPAGILMCIIYIITCKILLKNPMYYKEVINNTNSKKRNLTNDFIDAIWALLTPVIILGGIYSGVFTPTESAIIAVVYAFLVGMFVYKELTLKKFYKVIIKSMITSASIMFIISAANSFGWVLTINNVPQIVTKLFLSLINSKIIFLLISNIILIIAGMLMETISIISIIIPLLYPLCINFGVNPIHFGVIVVLNLSLGTLTPPFGGGLFVASGITKVEVSILIQRAISFIIAAVIGLIIVTYVPLLFI